MYWTCTRSARGLQKLRYASPVIFNKWCNLVRIGVWSNIVWCEEPMNTTLTYPRHKLIDKILLQKFQNISLFILKYWLGGGGGGYNLCWVYWSSCMRKNLATCLIIGGLGGMLPESFVAMMQFCAVFVNAVNTLWNILLIIYTNIITSIKIERWWGGGSHNL